MTPGKKNATEELVIALLAPFEVVGPVGVILYHCVLAYGFADELRLVVPVVLAVKMEP